jgi:amino acid permease
MKTVWKSILFWVLICLAFLFIGSLILLALDYVFGILGISLSGANATFSYGLILSLDAFGLSLLLSYYPPLAEKFAVISTLAKVLANVISVILMSLLMYFFSCWGLVTIAGIVCGSIGFIAFIQVTATAIIVNQVTDYASPDSQKVKELKALMKTATSSVQTSEDTATTSAG